MVYSVRVAEIKQENNQMVIKWGKEGKSNVLFTRVSH